MVFCCLIDPDLATVQAQSAIEAIAWFETFARPVA